MQEINSETSLYCVIGNPVRHSLSPKIHNSLFQKYGINSVYLAWDVVSNKLKDFFQAMRVLNIRGCNITLPHKIKSLNYLDKVDRDARVIGSVNTVLNEGSKLTGYNTDVFGIEMCLKKLKVNLKKDSFLVLGAGGAARAVLYCLAANNAAQIYLANRTYSKALNLKNYILKNYPGLKIQTLPLEENHIRKIISDVDCLINATSVGIRAEDSSIIPVDWLRKRQKVFDLTYNRKGTALVKACRERKIRAVDGVKMLIYQAMKSFQIWTAIFPEYKFLASKIKKDQSA